MTVKVFVVPRSRLRHPESEFILTTLQQLGFSSFLKLSIGRHYEFQVSDNGEETEESFRRKMEKFVRDRLTNHNTEDFSIEIE